MSNAQEASVRFAAFGAIIFSVRDYWDKDTRALVSNICKLFARLNTAQDFHNST